MELTNDRRWRSTKKIFIILLICLCINFILSAIAFAEGEMVSVEEAELKYYNLRDQLSDGKQSIFEFACSANGWNPEWGALNVIKGIGVIGTYTDAAGGERTEGIVNSDIVNFIRTTYSAVQVVGLAYLILYFFILHGHRSEDISKPRNSSRTFEKSVPSCAKEDLSRFQEQAEQISKHSAIRTRKDTSPEKNTDTG